MHFIEDHFRKLVIEISLCFNKFRQNVFSFSVFFLLYHNNYILKSWLFTPIALLILNPTLTLLGSDGKFSCIKTNTTSHIIYDHRWRPISGCKAHCLSYFKCQVCNSVWFKLCHIEFSYSRHVQGETKVVLNLKYTKRHCCNKPSLFLCHPMAYTATIPNHDYFEKKLAKKYQKRQIFNIVWRILKPKVAILPYIWNHICM